MYKNIFQKNISPHICCKKKYFFATKSLVDFLRRIILVSDRRSMRASYENDFHSAHLDVRCSIEHVIFNRTPMRMSQRSVHT